MWFNGKTGMIGKSYDGALAAATAVTGVDGLTTIVAESSDRTTTTTTRAPTASSSAAGIYVSSLANTVTDANRRAYCKPVRDTIDANDADATADFTTPFWSDRNYVDEASLGQGVGLPHARHGRRERPHRSLQPLLVRAPVTSACSARRG